MTANHLDALVALFAVSRTRRGVLAFFGGLGTGLGLADGEAKRKKKRKKKKKKPQIPPPPPPPPPPPGSNPGCPGPFDYSVGGAPRYAQTFIADRTGQLAAAQCQITGLNGGEDLVLEIRALDGAGLPTATILASVTIFDVPPVINPDTLTLAGIFDPPAPVTANVGYALVVTDPTGGAFFLRGRSPAICSGQLFLDFSADGSFDPNANADMVFSASIIV